MRPAGICGTSRYGTWSIQEHLPLHACSVLIWLAGLMLIRKDYRIYEFAYLMGIGGALQALLTPDIGIYGFPAFPLLPDLHFARAAGHRGDLHDHGGRDAPDLEIGAARRADCQPLHGSGVRHQPADRFQLPVSWRTSRSGRPSWMRCPNGRCISFIWKRWDW